MAGSGRIYERAGIYFIAYSHGGHEFRESTRSRNIEDAKRLLASRIVTIRRRLRRWPRRRRRTRQV